MNKEDNSLSVENQVQDSSSINSLLHSESAYKRSRLLQSPGGSASVDEQLATEVPKRKSVVHSVQPNYTLATSVTNRISKSLLVRSDERFGNAVDRYEEPPIFSHVSLIQMSVDLH